jgi:hypothetical protein
MLAGEGLPKLRAADWLCCLSFFYPFYWVALFAVNALPALLHAALPGHRLGFVRLGLFGAQAACFPPGETSLSPRDADRTGFFLIAGIVLAAGLLAARLLNRRLAGLFIASLGAAAMAQPLMGLFLIRRAVPSRSVAVAAFAALVLVFGLRWMLAACPHGWGVRLAAAAALFTLPVALFHSQAGFGPPQSAAMYAIPPLAASLVAAFTRLRIDVRPAHVSHLAAGVAASLLLAGGLHANNAARERERANALRATLAAIPMTPARAAYPKLFFQRGVNFTAEGRAGYEPEYAARMLDRLRTFGVNAVALVPYGSMRRGSATIRYGGGWERAELVEAVTRLAHARGMKVMLKPQIWVGGGGFPGDIEFPDARERAQWFLNYGEMVDFYAQLAARSHADIFVVGTEFGKLTMHEAEWRGLIARARKLYSGPITYAALQGPEFEKIRFWDALDYIGLNNYYPLPDDLSTAAVVAKVEAVQRRFGKPVIFPEAGFTSLTAPHREPWDETPRALSMEDQARCYEAVLKAFYKKPWFQGVYWWKVGTDSFGGPRDGSHTPWGKPAMDIVGKWYRDGGR